MARIAGVDLPKNKRMDIALDDAKKQGRDTVVEDFEEE